MVSGSRPLEVVFGGSAYLECPRWHEGKIWVSDFYTHEVLAARPGDSPSPVLEVPGQPAGLGWLPNGHLLVNSMKDRLIVRYDGARSSVYADLSDISPSHLNELVVDSAGRGQLTVIPDGLALDTGGAVWMADAMGHRAVRIIDGEVVDEVSIEHLGLLTVACALGGDDGRTLFLCANPALADEQASLDAMGGCVLSTRVEVPGAGHTRDE